MEHLEARDIHDHTCIRGLPWSLQFTRVISPQFNMIKVNYSLPLDCLGLDIKLCLFPFERGFKASQRKVAEAEREREKERPRNMNRSGVNLMHILSTQLPAAAHTGQYWYSTINVYSIIFVVLLRRVLPRLVKVVD